MVVRMDFDTNILGFFEYITKIHTGYPIKHFKVHLIFDLSRFVILNKWVSFSLKLHGEKETILQRIVILASGWQT